MADHLGYRQKFGVLGPSTNTIVQPDFDDLRPVGVTNHYSRIAIPNNPVNDNESFLKLVDNINKATLDAIDVLRISLLALARPVAQMPSSPLTSFGQPETLLCSEAEAAALAESPVLAEGVSQRELVAAALEEAPDEREEAGEALTEGLGVSDALVDGEAESEGLAVEERLPRGEREGRPLAVAVPPSTPPLGVLPAVRVEEPPVGLPVYTPSAMDRALAAWACWWALA
jgi:hypothetical protein